MLVSIKKPFPWSADGVKSTEAVPGTTVDIPDVLVPGLRAEGFVGDPDPDGAPAEPREPAAPAPEAEAEKEPALLPETEDAPSDAAAPLSAAELVDRADAMEWKDFREAAKGILGDAMPTKKDDIIVALMGVAG